MPNRHFIAAILVILAAAALMRGVWLTADPPVGRAVGIVWHDEGAWVHNARNQALWGTWRTDAWNPVFVAPVFTALEFAAFKSLGVGTWQARTVPAISGFAAVIALMIGLHALAGRRAAVIGGLLLATNYAFVMWNRAALMESTMTALMVIAWMAWTLAGRRPVWGLVAGLAAVAAFFTKAAAAFFIAAIGLELLVLLGVAWRVAPADRRQRLQQVAWTLTGLVAATVVTALLFVWPHWTDYQFYNWQMSVTRKPSYTLRAFIDRATWLPVVQGLFSGMTLELLAGLAGLMAIAVNWRTARSGERLLVWWILVGLAELVAHDSGNERRYVMFIPAFLALASLLLSRTGVLVAGSQRLDRATAVASLSLLVPVCYLAIGTLLRPWLLDSIEAGRLSTAVRLSGAAALLLVAVVAWRGRQILAWTGRRTLAARLALVVVAAAVAWQVFQFTHWAGARTTYNRDASASLRSLVPDGTLVQGKLANGMSLENRIRPVFVGNGFGNFDDRLRRDDARYILTYDLPRIGYESSDGSGLIQGILDHYPQRRVMATFQVDETRDDDRAVLIAKFPDDSPAHARD